jgi:Glycosyl transferase family 2/Glycosyl transferases group 1
VKILFVCFPYSVHAANWVSFLKDTGSEIHIFPSQVNNVLHENFKDVTYWPVEGLPFAAEGRERLKVERLSIEERDGLTPAQSDEDLAPYLAKVLERERFDIVHSMEFQHACYTTMAALECTAGPRPIWIATNYGADIFLFGKEPAHEVKIRQVLALCDYYSSECHRDVELARSLGFDGKVFTVLPHSGGINLPLALGLRSPGPTSARHVIAVKGYQHFAGRALTALKAIEFIGLEPFRKLGSKIKVFAAFQAVRTEADRLRMAGFDIECLSDHLSYEEYLALHGSARVSIAVSTADGISTTLLEAMAMGSFPVQTNTACANEWILDGQTGYVVDPDNPSQIADCLYRALHDDALVNYAAARNLVRISQNANVSKIKQKVIDAYEAIRPGGSVNATIAKSLVQTDHQKLELVRPPGAVNLSKGLADVGLPSSVNGPILTILTPSYNRADFLAETIESVLNERFANLEFIVIDDGSTDNTAEVVGHYGSEVTYLRQSNIGETATVNKGLGLARGEFIMIVNSDDPVLPGCLHRMVSTLRTHPDVLAAYPDWVSIGPKSELLNKIKQNEHDLISMLVLGNVGIGPGACFRRKAFDIVGLRNPLLKYSADLDLWYRLALAGKILRVPEFLATHREHPTSASVSDRGARLADEVVLLYNVYSQHPLLKPEQRRTVRRARAVGHFAAMFVSSTLRSATNQLIYGLMENPTAMLSRVHAHNIDEVIRVFQRLDQNDRESRLRLVGATAISTMKERNTTDAVFSALLAAPTRHKALRSMIRGLVGDPIGMLERLRDYGMDSALSRLRHLPTR